MIQLALHGGLRSKVGENVLEEDFCPWPEPSM